MNFEKWNLTSVDNTAYLALNANNSEVKTACLNSLDNFKYWALAQTDIPGVKFESMS